MSLQHARWLCFARTSGCRQPWWLFVSASLLYAAVLSLAILRSHGHPRQKGDLGAAPEESYLSTTLRMVTFRNPNKVGIYQENKTEAVPGAVDSQRYQTASGRIGQQPQQLGNGSKGQTDVLDENKLLDLSFDLSLERLEKQDGRNEERNKQSAPNQYSGYQKVFGENSSLGFAENTSDMTVSPHVLNILRDMVFLPADDHLTRNESFFRVGAKVVNEFPPGFFVISAPDVCRSEESPSLLVLVPSVVDHVEIRAAIRSTWGSLARGEIWPGRRDRLHVKMVFVFGVTDYTDTTSNKSRILTDESQRYGDVVQGDFVDSYRNLSIKMAAALQWSATYCPGARHVLKADEDTFVNIPLLMDILDRMTSLKKFVLGHRHYSAHPSVARRGRWAVEKELYPFSTFPAYLFGHSYVISGPAVGNLLAAYKRRAVMPNEDALFTGVLAKISGVIRIHSSSFAHEVKREQWKQTWCDQARGLSVSRTHFWRVNSFLNMWGDLVRRRCHGDA